MMRRLVGILGVLALVFGIGVVADAVMAPKPHMASVPVFPERTYPDYMAGLSPEDRALIVMKVAHFRAYVAARTQMPSESAAIVRERFDAPHKDGSDTTGRLFPIEDTQ